jgi:hypothetical protein
LKSIAAPVGGTNKPTGSKDKENLAMRNISFTLTKSQIRDRSKTVTRRVGWWNLKAGDIVRGVEKGMGLKLGEKVQPLATIRIVNVRSERLKVMTVDVDYGFIECIKEGFGTHPTLQLPSEFVQFFCSSHRGCTPDTVVNRIEFEYIE